MRRSTNLLFLASFAYFGILSTVQTSRAAEIRLTPTAECPVTITGRIIVGDSEKLQNSLKLANLENLSLEESEEGKHSVCLNSHGGAYLEGLIMGQMLFRNGVGTRIVSGAQCYSACALIFMSGRIRGNENDGTYRYLHVNGDLGLHAPYLSLSEGIKFSNKDIEDVFDTANRMAALFIQLYSYRPDFSDRPWISTSLIAEMYATSRDSQIKVDTLDKANRWDISLYGTAPIKAAGEQQLIQACHNFQKWAADAKSDDVPIEVLQMLKGKLKKDKSGFSRVDFGGMAELHCLIKVTASGYEICSVNGFSGINHGKCPEYGIFKSFLIGLPPQTNIRRLAAK